MIGMIPGMLQRKMKMNRLSRNGVHLSPDLPRVCITMPSSMNSIVVSARLRDAGRGEQRIAPGGEQEQHDADQRRGDGDEGDLVERREDVLPTQDLVDRWELESEHVVSVSVVSV